uniref:Lambda 2 n=1 Tax=Phocid orthoreovirus 1 TaxID=2854225 RepID=A0A7L5EXB1_9REOV|nr:Lambda 2 [Phocid orthoreovirus 1]
MANVWGVRLADSLSSPTLEKNNIRYTLLDFCNDLDCKGVSCPWKPLVSSDGKTVVAVRLLRPLNGLTFGDHVYGFPDNYDSWKDQMISDLAVLKSEVLYIYPISTYSTHTVNPIVAAALVNLYLGKRPYYSVISNLLVRETVINDLLYGDSGSTDCYHKDGDVLVVRPGRKYLTFSAYSNHALDPPLFCKDIANYALTIYANDYPTLDRYCWTKYSGSGILVHYDKPTFGCHYVIPSMVQMVSATPHILESTDAILLESLLEQFSHNSSVRPAQPVVRVDECYHMRWGMSSFSEDSLTYRLLCLSLAATNGYQLASPPPGCLTNLWVSCFVSQLLSDGGNGLNLSPVESYVRLAYDSPSVADGVTTFGYRRCNSILIGLPVSQVASMGNVSHPVRWLPQYSSDVFSPEQAMACYDKISRLPLRPDYGFFWYGDALVSCYDFSPVEREVSIDELPEFPGSYFDGHEVYARSLFSMARKVGDKSLAKDTAVLRNVCQVVNPDTGKRYLSDGLGVAYLGAAASHGDENQPLIIKPWLNGKIPGLLTPSSVRQFGYDVANGSIVDITRAFPGGTYQLVYCDVDQVVDGDDTLDRSSALFESLLRSCLSLTAPNGVFVIKVNFPTRRVFYALERIALPLLSSYQLVKPFLVNNLELFFCGFGVGHNGVLKWTSGAYFFLHSQVFRYQSLNEVVGQLPSHGYVDDGLSPVGVEQIVIENPGFSPFSVETVAGISYVVARSGFTPKRISFAPLHGARMLSVSTYRTPLSSNRMERMKFVPSVDSHSLEVQNRDILPTNVQLFTQSSIASPYTCLTMMLNAEVQRAIGTHESVLDLGTGPEARILSLLPATCPITCVDVRPFSEPETCWQTRTRFLVLDYLTDGWMHGQKPDVVTCVLSLGAAADAKHITMKDALTLLCKNIAQTSANVALIQLNCPTTVPHNIPGLLTVDRTTKTYKFHNSNRVEPFCDIEDAIAVVQEIWPTASVSWVASDPDLSWTHLALLECTALQSENIAAARQLLTMMPLMRVDIHSSSFRVDDVITVGHPITLEVSGFSDLDVVLGYFDGTLAFNSSMPEAAMIPHFVPTYLPTTKKWQLECRFSNEGVYTIQMLLGSTQTHVSVGSFIVDPPSFEVTELPWDPDFGIDGTDIKLEYNSYYRLLPFVKIGDEWQPASLDKFFLTSDPLDPSTHTLNVKIDVADKYLTYVLRDIQSRDVGKYINYPLRLLNEVTLPSDSDLLLSAPDTREWAVKESGNVICILNSPHFVMPGDWDVLSDTISWLPSNPTFIVPPGD